MGGMVGRVAMTFGRWGGNNVRPLKDPEIEAERVIGGQEGGQQQDAADDGVAGFVSEAGADDLVLGEEAGQQRQHRPGQGSR